MERGGAQERKLEAAFASTPEYFAIMRQWHTAHGGCAVEPEMLSLLTSVAKGNVLEAGCGEGSIVNYLAAGNRNLDCVGVDISPLGLQMGREKAPGVRFIRANLKRLPFQSGQFDLIFAQSVLEHLYGYRQALAELVRVLRPGGLIALRTGNGAREGGNILWAILRYLFRLNRIRTMQPSMTLGPDIEHDHLHNFDACQIPSDILLNDLRELGLRITFFTTMRHMFLSRYRNALDKYLRQLVAGIPFFPFTHLGPTIIVGARKDNNK